MPIITISRGSMSGGQTLAECVASALQIPCVGREILVAAAAKIGVSAEMLSSKLETSPGVWDRFTTERGLYVAAVQASLAELVAGGDLVYHGHAGHLLLRGLPAVLRVRLIAPIAMRLRAVMERQRLKPDAALAYIQKVDEGRIRWARFLYNVDLTDPGLYDLVLSLESMSIRSACSVVSATAKQPEFVVTDEVREEGRRFRVGVPRQAGPRDAARIARAGGLGHGGWGAGVDRRRRSAGSTHGEHGRAPRSGVADDRQCSSRCHRRRAQREPVRATRVG